MVSVHAAPTMTPEDRRLSSSPKWVNPCGLAAEDFTGDLDVVQLTDSQLLQQVVVQAKTALTHAELFRDDYVSTDCTFIYFLYRFTRARVHTRARARARSLWRNITSKRVHIRNVSLQIFWRWNWRATSPVKSEEIKFINGSIITDVIFWWE